MELTYSERTLLRYLLNTYLLEQAEQTHTSTNDAGIDIAKRLYEKIQPLEGEVTNPLMAEVVD